MGPLINERAVEAMMAALETAQGQGGEVVYGGKRLDRPGYFVEPTIVRAEPVDADRAARRRSRRSFM